MEAADWVLLDPLFDKSSADESDLARTPSNVGQHCRQFDPGLPLLGTAGAGGAKIHQEIFG